MVPLLFSPVIVQRRYERIPPFQAVHVLQQMAQADAQTFEVQIRSIGLTANSPAQRVWNVWRWLPTRYVRELNGDDWQYAADTLAYGGDCEDWSIVLCAHLRAVGIDARMGLMPDHAAVLIPLARNQGHWQWQPFVGFYKNPNLIPESWPTMEYKGSLWLPLESTLSPETRGLPGHDAEMIRRWARQGMLWIA